VLLVGILVLRIDWFELPIEGRRFAGQRSSIIECAYVCVYAFAGRRQVANPIARAGRQTRRKIVGAGEEGSILVPHRLPVTTVLMSCGLWLERFFLTLRELPRNVTRNRVQEAGTCSATNAANVKMLGAFA